MQTNHCTTATTSVSYAPVLFEQLFFVWHQQKTANVKYNPMPLDAFARCWPDRTWPLPWYRAAKFLSLNYRHISSGIIKNITKWNKWLALLYWFFKLLYIQYDFSFTYLNGQTELISHFIISLYQSPAGHRLPTVNGPLLSPSRDFMPSSWVHWSIWK